MSLTIALNNSLSSLKVNQDSLSLVAQNIANANVDDYTRREIEQVSQVVNGVVAGAEIKEVRRAVDNFLVAAARNQISDLGKTETLKDFFDKTELFFGQPGQENSLNAFLDNFFTGLSDLANSPEQTFLRNNAVQFAVNLATKVAGTANNIEEVRFEVEQEITRTITEFNSAIDRLDALNVAIKEASRLNSDKNGLFDERDALLEDVAKTMDVIINFSSIGEATIGIATGEILAPGQKSHITNVPLTSVGSFINGTATNPIELTLLDSTGAKTTSKQTLVSASNATTKVTNFTSGKLKGLVELRDDELPKILAQLDELAQTLQDAVNAIHNDGAGFPPPSTLTGLTSTFTSEEHVFTGKVRIGLVKSDGTPVASAYTGGGNLPPLTLDLSRLDGAGNGQGKVTADSIVREINSYFGAPPSLKATLGPLDDIRIAAKSGSINITAASATIAFNGNPGVGDTITLGPLGNQTTYTFVANGTASNGTNIELKLNQNDTVQEIARHLNTVVGSPTADATYSATNNTLTITHVTAGNSPNGVHVVAADVTNGGGTISINGAGAAASDSDFLQNGADASGNFEFDFEFMNTSAKDATFEVLAVTATGSGADGFQGTLPGDFTAFTAKAGERVRTGVDAITKDTITISLNNSTLEEGATHNIAVQMRVTDGNGVISNETITFQLTIPDPSDDIRNVRYAASALGGGGNGVLTAPASSQPFLTAAMVDSTGKTVATGSAGFLKLTANGTGVGIVIDELDSKEGGLSTDATTATNRGMAHYFGLNNLFTSNTTLKGTAVNLKVRDDIVSDPSKLTTGGLTLSAQPADPTAAPIYTYEIGQGDNQTVLKMSNLRFAQQTFDAAGTLPQLTVTFGTYSSEIIGFSSLKVSGSQNDFDQAKLLFDAFNDRLKSTGGVNVDEELANTIVFQNNYAASARMVNVVSRLFEELINVF